MIAVIIPIYNQEKYLARALDSLAAQTCRDILAICVDDGSTDATAAILTDYGRRGVVPMRVISKANGGVSSARNAGLDLAVTLPDVTHVSFLDPDDFVHPQCYEIATRFVTKFPTMAVSWDYALADEVPAADFLSRRYEAACLVPKPFKCGATLWNMVFPISAVATIRFNERLSVVEDTAFVHEACHRGRLRGCHLSADLYYYDSVPGSAIHRQPTRRTFAERREAMNYMVGLYADDRRAYRRFARTFVASTLKRYYRDLKRVVPGEKALARHEFVGLLSDLLMRGALLPHQGELKDIKYYVLFRWMIWREGRSG